MIEKYRSREIRSEIRRVLIELWDPIGVREVPEAQDEYNSYLGGVYELVTGGASADQVIDHLLSIERDRMGLSGRDKASLIPVARALLAINVRT